MFPLVLVNKKKDINDNVAKNPAAEIQWNILLIFDYFAELNIMIFPLFLF